MPKITKPDADRKTQRAPMLQTNAKGEVEYAACFAAGTLVHTDRGLLPIEQVRVGVMVLSKPENSDLPAGQGQEYRRVINTVAMLDQRIHAVQVKVQGEEQLTTLFPTPNHPFWVEGVIVDDQHWLATECLAPGMVLQLADGRKATVHANGLVRRTQHEGIAVARDDRSGVEIVLDHNGGRIAIASNDLAASLRQLGPRLELGDPCLTTVYNFEVVETHTYYVGDTAVWVHNANCPDLTAEQARQATLDNNMRNAELSGNCFEEETLVYVEGEGEWGTGMRKIRDLKLGEKVLSRCEVTGEMAYKRITKIFDVGHAHTRTLRFKYDPIKYPKTDENDVLRVTGEHPFWVKGKGWVEVRNLQVGDVMSTFDDDYAELASISEEDRLWDHICNIEVEDFHTYFVDCRGYWVHNKTKATTTSLNLKQIEDAPPVWTPLYKSVAELMESDGITPLNDNPVGWVDRRETQHHGILHAHG